MTLAGVFAPVPTPFDRNGNLDLERLKVAFRRWVASPLTGFVVLGSNGEAVLLDEDESDRVIAAARDTVPRGRPFIVGTGRESTAGAVRASRRAAALGADAVLVRTPGFFRPQMTTEAFVRHYSAVADASPVPVLLYNFTAMTGVQLLPEAVSRLAGHENVVGMKESGGDVDRIARLVASAPAGFSLLAGSARTFLPALRAGAVGGILALAAVVPEGCVRLFELSRMGADAEARLLQQRLAPLAELLGSILGVAGLKAALNLTGFDCGYPRSPLVPLGESETATVRGALHLFQETPA
jgi:4-hydroxy-2-oxoglutarate aldolase